MELEDSILANWAFCCANLPNIEYVFQLAAHIKSLTSPYIFPINLIKRKLHSKRWEFLLLNLCDNRPIHGNALHHG